MSDASDTYRKNAPADEVGQSDVTQFTKPGELSLTPELIAAFQRSLEEYSIEIKFISGSWWDTNMWISNNPTKFDLILSSETIYRVSSLPSLITLLQNATSQRAIAGVAEASSAPPLCLIAAKVVYFGVGGGMESFTKAVEESGGHCQTVYETKEGVARKIIKISWI